MKTALVTREGELVGREYYGAMVAAALPPDLVVLVGRVKAESHAFELMRTGGHWNPPEIPDTAQVVRVGNLADVRLAALLAEVDIAIQGSVGIIKPPLLAAPRFGWLNVHPGRLPQYRGSACPEWAVLSGDKVCATAHFLDVGIDTGPVILESVYEFDATDSYERFRAGVYPHCADVLVRAIREIEKHGPDAARPQGDVGACYRSAMTVEQLAQVKGKFGRVSVS